MANRYFNNQAFTMEPAIVKLFAKVSFGNSGAPTLSATESKGVVSVTRDNQGIFTFVFGTQAGMLDVYYKLKHVAVIFDTSGVGANTAPAAPIVALSANAVATPASCSLQITLFDADTPAATDPASGEIGYFEFTLKNSNAP